MVVAGGQDHLKGKIFRVGHMGAYDLADMHAVLGALEECAAALGQAPSHVGRAARRRARPGRMSHRSQRPGLRPPWSRPP